jgi:lipopolysaccharide export system protein LptC
MKWVVIALMTFMVVCGSAFGATLNLKATWTANTETDMASYKLYRTDGTRTLIGTIAFPSTTYNFSVTVTDNSSGTLTYVLTAVDTASNESADSATASYHYDLVLPTAPKNLLVTK